MVLTGACTRCKFQERIAEVADAIFVKYHLGQSSGGELENCQKMLEESSSMKSADPKPFSDLLWAF